MKHLIKSIKLSKREAVIGESIQVEIKIADPAVEVTVNNVGGATHFLQFKIGGSQVIVITASLGKQMEQKAETVKIRDRVAGEPALPLIWSTMDRYQPRTVVLTVANAEQDLTNVREYEWDFGDGTQGVSERGGISHDYSDALDPDKLFTQFHVQVKARQADGSVASATCTIAVFHVYAYNKIRKGILTPRVTVLDPVTIPLIFSVNEVLCSFTIQNLEDEELSFTAEKYEWLTTDEEEPQSAVAVAPRVLEAEALSQTMEAEVAPRLLESGATSSSHFKRTFVHTPPTMDLRVPARGTITVTRVFLEQQFKRSVFGVAIHLSGIGTCSKLPVMASAYIEVKLPLQWSGYVKGPRLASALSAIARADLQTSNTVTHDNLREFVRRDAVANAVSPNSTPLAPDGAVALETSSEQMFARQQFARPRSHEGTPRSAEPQATFTMTHAQVSAALPDLLSPEVIPFDWPSIVYGTECDPDNLPDDLPGGAVCQLTGEYAWRFVPGRVLNAKKGDVILSPGNQTMIAQLLRQVVPPQYYSHSGIMTKNHIEVRHSTGSPEWLRDHPKGGGKPTDGFEPTALKYLWPGTITQSIDQACYFQWLISHEGAPYMIKAFSFDPDVGNRNTLVYPVVVKPPPFEETAQVRLTLHAIANAALGINGHYRFYCYTRPEMALDPGSAAGPEAGWAQGTLPTVCSSFIWLAAQHAGVRLEGPDTLTKATDLEPKDVTPGGAEADALTRDGLYHYTAEERQAASRWLYQHIYNEAYSSAGFFGTLFTDAPDDIANQICNTFASDWADGDSKDSDAWQHTGPANAVSPDNILFWDSPASENQGQFRSVYGYMEELFYRPGTYARVPIYRWKHVETHGTLTGKVVANDDVAGANVSLLGTGLQDVVVNSDGQFKFENVPSGDYTVSAGLNINGYWNSAEVAVHIDAGKTTDITIALEPPPEVDRLVTISVEMETDWKSIWAHSTHPFSGTKSVRIHPFHSHEHLDFDGSDTPRGHLGFDIDLNADLSITVSWTAQEIDDEVEGEIKGGYTISKDGILNWSGLRVVNDDPIDADWTTMNFTILNELASA